MGNDSLFRQALALERDRAFAEAFTLFQHCCSDPAFDEGDLAFHCGWCLENMQQSEQALAFYAKAAELSRIPSCKVNSYFRSGWIAMHERKHENAADFFRKAIDCGDLLFVQDDAYRHATYWYAVCLEAEGLYLDALVWYRRAQSLSPLLEPESRYRQILWLVRIGLYDEALNVCRTFDAPPPEEFDRSRYEELRSHARHERNMLAACVNSEPAALDAGRERQGDAYAIR